MTVDSPARRRVIQALFALGSSLALSPATFAQPPACPPWLASKAIDAIGDAGREYLSVSPADRGIDDIWALANEDTEAALTALRKRVADDYAAGRLVRLSGWFVSVTEAQLFAAVASHC